MCRVLTLPLERERSLNVRHLLPSPSTSKRLLASRSASMAADTVCRAIVDIRVCSLSVDTSLYPVTLPGASSTLRLEALKVPSVEV